MSGGFCARAVVFNHLPGDERHVKKYRGALEKEAEVLGEQVHTPKIETGELGISLMISSREDRAASGISRAWQWFLYRLPCGMALAWRSACRGPSPSSRRSDYRCGRPGPSRSSPSGKAHAAL